MFAGKPIIGIVGGIGSGKSFVARIFGEMGCAVLDADEYVRQLYEREDVKRTLRQWWGEGVFEPDGQVNRAAIARRIFDDEGERRKLEALLHPKVADMREAAMVAEANDAHTRAFVWDVPLLVEAGHAGQCDALVFVDSPPEERQRRVRETRGWTASELTRREKFQLPLDKKREMAKYMVRNTAGAGDIRSQVREVLLRILAGIS